MKIKRSSLIFNNVLSATVKSSHDEWLDDLVDLRDTITTEEIYPTGPSFFTISDEDKVSREAYYTFYVPLNREINLKNNDIYKFYKKFNIKDGVSIRLVDLESDIQEAREILKTCVEENNLKIKEPFYNIYLENYGVETIQVYTEIFS